MFDRRQNLPDARSDELLIEDQDEGVVVYDRRNDTAHWLDAAAASVWRMANGQRTIAELAAVCCLSESAVSDVLLRLDGLELMQEKADDGVSRRAVLRRMAKIGGTAAIVGPIISTIVVPNALATSSVCAKVTCNGFSFANCNSAKRDANGDCTSAPGCRSASTCVGTCSVGFGFSYSGTCSF